MQADFESANRHFQSIIELYPGSLSYLDGYSNLLYIEEKHTELGNLAQLCQEADPFSRETYCITGNYFSAKGRSLKAIELFKKSIFIDDEYQLPWLLLGQELVKLGKSAEGISALYKAADLEPTDYRVWHYLGVAYQQSGMEDDSLYYFRKATELKKNDVQLLLHMSGEFHRRKKFVEASKHLRMAHSINPSASILSHLIGCYLEMEDISNASLHIEEYLNSYSDLSPILDSLFSLAGKMESRGDLEKSSKYFSLCLCDPEREPQCLEALGRIAACLGVDLQSLIRSSDRILDLRDSSRLSYSSLDQDQEQEEEENISNESEDMDMDLSP